MSAEEDLIDYSDEDIQATDNAQATTSAANGTKDTDAAKTKGSYVGVHSSGFRDFLLRPELVKAITDCGFEHPSEG